MSNRKEISGNLKEIGFSTTDTDALLECMFKGGSVSWINTDPVTQEMLEKLGTLITENDFKLRVSVEEIPNRGKYIWDVKLLA